MLIVVLPLLLEQTYRKLKCHKGSNQVIITLNHFDIVIVIHLHLHLLVVVRLWHTLDVGEYSDLVGKVITERLSHRKESNG